uniref:Mitochondrial import inner membrane translocase subunit n=1 Tax=Podarcis muralis TaxID=64176 RepID=A0A670JYP1_PODMU
MAERMEADVSELQRLVAPKEQQARLTTHVHNFMEVCWEKRVDKPGSKLDSRTETCLTNCINCFIDTTLSITTNCLAQIVQKGGH